jgi:TetR/AcrR family transcriptional repressor of bet genes
MADLCADVIRDGGYVGLDPVVVAAGLISMNQGLWLDVLLIPRVRSRTRARDICLSHLARVFPAHFRDPMDT